ncbi:MAG: hypothetical protein EOP51_24025, partial [Sphingobacteriales bacterium]
MTKRLLHYFFLLTCICLVSESVDAQNYQYPVFSPTANTIPFANSTSNLRQWIYYPTDFYGAPSGTITTLYFKASGSGNVNFANLTIKMGATSLNIFPNATFVTGLTTVYNGAYSATVMPSNYVVVNLQTPYLYDNSQNLIIEASQTGFSPGFSIALATTGVVARSLYGASTAVSGTVQDRLADMGFDIVTGTCTNPIVAGQSFASPAFGVCPGSSVFFGLSGTSVGAGQSYQWETSPSASGPYTPVGAAQWVPNSYVNVSNDGYYRAAVSCGFGVAYSTPVHVSVSTGMSGTYTINSFYPESPTNFHSFAAFTLALSCGVVGPVILNVEPGSYNEQVVFNAVPGSSATNSITINGNGATIMAAPFTSNRHVLKINGTDYLTLANLNIVGYDQTYGYGIHLTNGAENIVISNCNIDLSAISSTTAGNSGCIVASASGTSVTSAGNNCSNIVITGNTLTGAYHGISINGSSGSSQAVTLIASNQIQDFYSIGIVTTNVNGGVLKNNNISRANRGAVGVFEGIEIGTGTKNMVIDGNRIHDTHNSATTQSGTAYGIYASSCDAPAGSENRVINNLIYNFNSGSGTIYGLYNSSSDGFYYYHNTVVLDNVASTSGTTRGLYQLTSATGIDIKNNI